MSQYTPEEIAESKRQCIESAHEMANAIKTVIDKFLELIEGDNDEKQKLAFMNLRELATYLRDENMDRVKFQLKQIERNDRMEAKKSKKAN